MNEEMRDFLEGLVHGPCASIGHKEYERFVRNQAAKILADKNLKAAGCYGRTIERWWSGFYGKFTVEQTAGMNNDQITLAIFDGSRRG